MRLRELFENTMALIPVYRGMRLADDTNEGDTVPINIRQDRRPADISVFASVVFNRGIEMRFSIPEIRKRACFGSTNQQSANNYANTSLKRVGGLAGTVQLMVPGDTDIVFHPDTTDSMDILDGFDWYGFDTAMNVWKEENADNPDAVSFATDLNNVDRQAYIADTATQFWMRCLRATIKDESKYPALMADFDQKALEVTEGYQRVKASAFNNAGPMECILVGITSCQARVVQVFNEIEGDDDDYYE